MHVSCAPGHKSELGAQSCTQACRNALRGSRAACVAQEACAPPGARCVAPAPSARFPQGSVSRLAHRPHHYGPWLVPSQGPFSKWPHGAEQTRMLGGAAPSTTLPLPPGGMQALPHVQIRAPARPYMFSGVSACLLVRMPAGLSPVEDGPRSQLLRHAVAAKAGSACSARLGRYGSLGQPAAWPARFDRGFAPAFSCVRSPARTCPAPEAPVQQMFLNFCVTESEPSIRGGYGATAARLTPDQKVGSSNLSGLTVGFSD
jgi:hypothetical protein